MLIRDIAIDFITLLNDNDLTIGNQIDILNFFSNHVPRVVNGKRYALHVSCVNYLPIENEDENIWYNCDEAKFFNLSLT